MSEIQDIPTAPAAPLIFTDAAAGKVSELLAEEENPELKLRVFISGGGCSGFQYGFTFDEKVEEGDTRIENSGVTLQLGDAHRLINTGNRPARLNQAMPYYTEAMTNLRLRILVHRLEYRTKSPGPVRAMARSSPP